MKFPHFLRMSAAETIYNRGIAEGVWEEETLKSKIRLVARFRGTQDVAHGKSLLLRHILLGITVPQTLVMKSPLAICVCRMTEPSRCCLFFANAWDFQPDNRPKMPFHVCPSITITGRKEIPLHMKKKNTYDPERRTYFVHARMNEEEWQTFLAQVESLGITQSEFIRQAVTTAAVKVTVQPVYDSEVLDEIAAQCGKIGSNINQIARHLNENNPIEARLIKECRHGIAEISDIKKTLEKLDGGI